MIDIGIFVYQTGYSVDTAVLAKRAEELGFGSFWVNEHPIMPVNIPSPYHGTHVTSDGEIQDSLFRNMDPFITLARASAVTQTIKLGTGVCLVPERNPLILAKQIATLDHFSGGRFIFGIGAGWLKEETEIMGGDFDHRWNPDPGGDPGDERALDQGRGRVPRKVLRFPPVRCYPKPAQKPHPPVLLGGDAKNVFKRVVEWGDGWVPHVDSVEKIKRGRAILDELAEKAGRDPGSIEVLAFSAAGEMRDPKIMRELEDCGVNRVTVRLMHDQQDEALAEMEELAQQFLA